MKRLINLTMYEAVDRLRQFDYDFSGWQQGQAIHLPRGLPVSLYVATDLQIRTITGWMMERTSEVKPEIVKPSDAQTVHWSLYEGGKAVRIAWQIDLVPTGTGITIKTYKLSEKSDKPYFNEFIRRLKRWLDSVQSQKLTASEPAPPQQPELQQSGLSTHATVQMQSLPKPQIKRNPRGRKPMQAYEEAFEAIYITRTHGRKEAFNKFILEPEREKQGGKIDASMEASLWKSFETAMSTRFSKHPGNTQEIPGK